MGIKKESMKYWLVKHGYSLAVENNYAHELLRFTHKDGSLGIVYNTGKGNTGTTNEVVKDYLAYVVEYGEPKRDVLINSEDGGTLLLKADRALEDNVRELIDFLVKETGLIEPSDIIIKE